MSVFVFDPSVPSIPILGSSKRFPVHRIYCVGANYTDHVREMGGAPGKPVFFTKPADAIVDASEAGASIPYPLATENLHHEIELVVAIGKDGAQIPVESAASHVWGCAVGLDLTRRDLQAAAKASGKPWDTAKAFDQSAPISTLVEGYMIRSEAKLGLSVNGERKQEGVLGQMIWSVPEVVSHLSDLFHLRKGDLIFTGTPAGVGPLVQGDMVEAKIDGLPDLRLQIER